MAHEVLVVGELTGDAPSATTLELLGQATRLAEGGTVSVALLGSGAAAAVAGCAGAQRAYVAEDAEYDTFRAEQWLPALEAALDGSGADLVLIPQTTGGRELGPRLAHRRQSAAAMDCIDLVEEGGTLRATRPAYGGNAVATYTFATSPAIVTVRAKSFDAVEAAGPAETRPLPAAGESRLTVVGREQAESEGLQLQEAPIVVVGGRGLGGDEGFTLLEQLAEAFGNNRAAVGASRAAVDSGWYPPSQQIGLTGKVVSPDLYLAVAVSGASQHMSGCSGSKTIVAINRDPEANIFAHARYGIVGDYKQVVPALIEALRGA
ncbi:MAG: electron transfer flavoprotein subunit alpha/FixB family protein [Dehalococcoidia bacterium]